MKDLGFGLVDQRTIIVVLITSTLATLLLGFPFPIDTSNVLNLFLGLILLTGYLYLMRTLIRLPFAVVIGIKASVKGEDYFYDSENGEYRALYYELRRRYSDEKLQRVLKIRAFVNAFQDQKTWKGFFGFIDRLGLVAITILVAIPSLNNVLLQGFGVAGLALMLLIYLSVGTFSFLIEDAIQKAKEEQIAEQARLRQTIIDNRTVVPPFPTSIEATPPDPYKNAGFGGA